MVGIWATPAGGRATLSLQNSRLEKLKELVALQSRIDVAAADSEWSRHSHHHVLRINPHKVVAIEGMQAALRA